MCIWETLKQVFLKTVKTQIKCSIMLHFIRVNTVCKGQKDLQTEDKYNIFGKLQPETTRYVQWTNTQVYCIS